MRNIILASTLMLLAMPAAAQNVSVGEGDWSNIPALKKNRVVQLSPDSQSMIDRIALEDKCKALGRSGRINLAMPFLVEFTADNAVASILVKRIGCPDVESIAANTALRAAQSGKIKPDGDNAAGWYQGEVSYTLQY